MDLQELMYPVRPYPIWYKNHRYTIYTRFTVDERICFMLYEDSNLLKEWYHDKIKFVERDFDTDGETYDNQIKEIYTYIKDRNS